VGGGQEQRLTEHQVSYGDSGNRSSDPCRNVEGNISPDSLALPRVSERHDGIEVGPETGPKARIKDISTAPVAIEFARRAMATLPEESRSPMMPEPTTAARRKSVPKNSAVMRRARVGIIGFRSA
jgi:hypothetical protein